MRLDYLIERVFNFTKEDINKMRKQYAILIIFIVVSYISKAQVYVNPISGKQSHPELEITQIEITNENTVVSLKVTNKRDAGGWFCADKDIYLKNSKGTEIYQLIRSENIPTCPEQFEFSYQGQVLEFKLYFPPISNKIKFLDLIENCNNACFSFYGIILDNEHNEKIRLFEKAYGLFQEKQFNEAIPIFEKVVDGELTIDSQIYGLSYYYIIMIYQEFKDNKKVDYWVERLKSSDFSDKNTIMKELVKSGINMGN